MDGQQCSAQAESIPFLVPLLPYERRQVNEIRESLDEIGVFLNPQASDSIETAFSKWRPARLIEDEFRVELGSNLSEVFRGDKSAAYQAALRTFTNLERYMANRARSEFIAAANPGTLDDITRTSNTNIRVCRAPEDHEAWKILAILCEELGLPEVYMDKRGLFDIWKLARIFFLEQQYPSNESLVRGIVIDNPSFKALYSGRITASNLPRTHSTTPDSLNHESPSHPEMMENNKLSFKSEVSNSMYTIKHRI